VITDPVKLSLHGDKFKYDRGQELTQREIQVSLLLRSTLKNACRISNQKDELES